MPLVEYKLPDIGEGIHEGEIVKWHVKPGDLVDEDQVIMEVQNDKAVVEITSLVKGKVVELKVDEGAKVVVGDVLIIFESEHQVSPPIDKPGANASPLAAPSVRKLARDHAIDLSQVKGTGKNGIITRNDVLNHDSGNHSTSAVATDSEHTLTSVSGNNSKERVERIPLKGIRRVIADAMVKSKYTAPHVTIMEEVDVTKLVELRETAKPYAARKGIKLNYLPFIAKALVASCRQFPIMNASIDDRTNEIVIKHDVHVGIATDTEEGLIVPVVKDADRKNIWKIASEINDLASRGRQRKLAPQELKGSTISISNMGANSGMFFTPIINYPEVAILGIGGIIQRPLVKNGEIVVSPVMGFSLSFDHRIIDGATARNFMNLIKQLIEQPELIMLEE